MPPVDPPLFRFSAISPSVHALSTRHGGVSEAEYRSLNLGLMTGDDPECVRENRARFASATGAAPESLRIARLTHGTEVSSFRKADDAEAREGALPWVDSDAVVTNVPGLHVLMTFADCVPIVLEDARTGAVAAVHAGWRGTAAGIAGNTVRTMRAAFGSDPGDIRAGIGPSIGPCCYTVGADVPPTFANHGVEPVLRTASGSLVLDLWQSNVRQLRKAGIPAEGIEVCGICTSCSTDEFFSHRAERGVTGRFGMIVGIR